jgi:hypothetical protein
MINLIKPIRDADAYMLAMAAVQELIKLDPALGTPEADQLHLLALIIEEYEKCQYGPLPDVWRDEIEARCAAAGVPFDPLDPALTVGGLIAHHVRSVLDREE